jgi:hypothetical protein
MTEGDPWDLSIIKILKVWEEGERRKEEGGRRKEKGGRRKEEWQRSSAKETPGERR